MSVLVLGGGITGLAAAYELGRAGVPTTVLEASPRLGGKVRTEQLDGFLVEAGPDSFVSYRPAASDLARELGLAGELIRPREPRTVLVRVNGRFSKLPDGMGLVLPTRLWPFVTTDLFSIPQKLRAGLDLVLPRSENRGDIAVGAFIARRLGRGLVDRLAGPLLGGVYGTPIDELSLDAVVPQLREAERRHRSLLLASLAEGRARARRGQPPGSPFITLRGGLGSLIDALVAAIDAMPSVEVQTETRVVSLDPRRRDVRARVERAGHSARTLRADAAILATPASVAAQLLEPAHPEAARQIGAIPHGTAAIVTLGYGPDQVPDGPTNHGFLVAGDEPLSLAACTFSSRKWEGRAPEGALLVRAFMRDDVSATLGDDELAAAAMRDLAALVGLRGSPTLSRVIRHPAAMPHYTVGHLARISAAARALADVPSVTLAGGAYGGVGLPDCIRQGRDAAKRVAGFLAGEDEGELQSRVAPAAEEGPTRLIDLPSGGSGRVASVPPGGDGLALEGIHPGSELTVRTRAPLGGPVVVNVGRARVAVPRYTAATICLEPSEPGPAARSEVTPGSQ